MVLELREMPIIEPLSAGNTDLSGLDAVYMPLELIKIIRDIIIQMVTTPALNRLQTGHERFVLTRGNSSHAVLQ